nr:RNA-directed DNA polymerase, eukaryota, reverse transcriptase zinc-binding domain protein [Tanacetum cinerariifolium]
NRRHDIIRLIQDIEKVDTLEMAQKAKINWAIEESPISVEKEFYDHFKNRFGNPSSSRIQLVKEFSNHLSVEQNANLEDGYTFGIYRRYWRFIENDIIEAIKWFFTNGTIPKGGNSCFITLIPKIPNANMFKDFRPISLIGSVYKIISKILANRLVLVLGDLVNEVQSAFVADRQILDGPFILNELAQWSKLKKKQTMVFKVDFEKAYDSVKWDFLDIVMKKFGFGERWCKWIQSCLQSSRGSVLVNGSPTQEFQFYKGLKQGGRLTLLKSVLGAFPIYHMSIFKVPMKVLKNMEAIRARFFNGTDINTKKPCWVSWKKVMALKDNGGLKVSSLYALNRALLFKWIRRFISKKKSIWASVIKALHGEDGKIGKHINHSYPSIWISIIKEVESLKDKGMDLLQFISPVMGNGISTSFWEVPWRGDMAFKVLAPRIYALKTTKNIVVASKLSHNDLVWLLRRRPRNGIEQAQRILVASVRKYIDDHYLPSESKKTRWIKEVPIKINILAWKVKNDGLPTRFNISRRGMEIDTITCPLCDVYAESTRHVFFSCKILCEVMRKIARWWELEYNDTNSYEEWLDTEVVADDDASSKEKEIDKLIALLSMSYKDDIDDELEDQELEAHYIYMEKIKEVTPDAAANSRPIFNVEPLQKNNGDTNITSDSSDMSINSEEVDQNDQMLSKNMIYSLL